MFTGIVADRVEILKIDEKQDFRSLTLAFPAPLIQGLEIGASVAINGVCLTVTEMESTHISFDVIQESLKRTNLGELLAGDLVNVERSLQAQDEIGGHTVSGHVDATATLKRIEADGENTCLWLSLDTEYLKYVFPKGFIALNGTSLTVGEVRRTEMCFCVYLIPETLRRTTFGVVQEGARINVEVERVSQVIVDTIERCLSELATPSETVSISMTREEYTALVRESILMGLKKVD